jgi:hypothetical protein
MLFDGRPIAYTVGQLSTPISSKGRADMSSARQAILKIVVFAILMAAFIGAASAATVHIHGMPGTRITVDGEPMGPIPLAGPLDLGSGTHLILGHKDGAMPFRREIQIKSMNDVIHLRVELIPYKRSDAVMYSLLLAGTGQRYLGRSKLGWVLTGAEVGGLLTALLSEMNMQNIKDDYLIVKSDYENELDVTELLRLRALVDEKYSDMKDAESLRDMSMSIAAAAVALSVMDAFFRFPNLDVGPGGISGINNGHSDLYSCHMGLSFQF